MGALLSLLLDRSALTTWIAREGIGPAFIQLQEEVSKVPATESARALESLRSLERGVQRHLSASSGDLLVSFLDYCLTHRGEFPWPSKSGKTCLTDGVVVGHLATSIGMSVKYFANISHLGVQDEATGLVVDLAPRVKHFSDLSVWREMGLFGIHQESAGPEVVVAALLYKMALEALSDSYDKSHNLARLALGVFPDYPAVLVHLYELGIDPQDKSRKYLEQALALHPDFARALVYQGLLYYNEPNLAQAKQALTRAVALGRAQMERKQAHFALSPLAPILDPDLEAHTHAILALIKDS